MDNKRPGVKIKGYKIAKAIEVPYKPFVTLHPILAYS
jgi:hypothetical protein